MLRGGEEVEGGKEGGREKGQVKTEVRWMRGKQLKVNVQVKEGGGDGRKDENIERV